MDLSMMVSSPLYCQVFGSGLGLWKWSAAVTSKWLDIHADLHCSLKRPQQEYSNYAAAIVNEMTWSYW